MIDLTQRWPLGLGPRTWPLYLLGALAAVALVAPFDGALSRAGMGWPDQVRGFFFFITDYGLAEWVLVPTLVIALCAFALSLVLAGLRRRAAWEAGMLAAYLFLAVGAPGLFTNLLKRLIGRARPGIEAAEGPFDFHPVFNDWMFQSFPSGHTTTAVAIAFAFGFLWPRLFPVLFAIGVVVGISRVPVGMHFPSDVVAGLVVGTVGAYGVRNLFAARRKVFSAHADGRVRPRGAPALRRLLRRWRQRAAA